MDIYQIWTTYNKKWSKYEILAFSVLLLLTVIVVAGCVCRKKINIIQAMAIVTMVIFLGIVFVISSNRNQSVGIYAWII